MDILWDLIVIGGGTSGCAAAFSASKKGLKTLIIEKNGFLGGTATGSLVTPMMKNILDNGTELSSGIIDEVLEILRQKGGAKTFSDGNKGWFNPELMKCALDEICIKYGTKILFDTVLTDAIVENQAITEIQVINNSGKYSLKSRYFIDASGDAVLSNLANVAYTSGKDSVNQCMTLRFNMANINMKIFSDWLIEIDPNTDISPIFVDNNDEILLSTAYTWDSKNWALAPYFEQAVNEGILEKEDSNYFQIFSIPGQKGGIAFNCPRIIQKQLNPLDMWDVSEAYIIGRQQIQRLAAFCKKYLPGFEEAFISQIAPNIGIRDSRRIEGKYELTADDIITQKKFSSVVAKSNYPIDIHSKDRDKSKLEHLNTNDYYEIPIEALMPKNINNMLVVGRCISAEFEAQASLRIQPNCWCIGESAGNYFSERP